MISHAKKRLFLEAFSTTGKLLTSCRRVAIDHTSHYYWLRTDPDYVDAFEQAKQMAADYLEECAIERATREDAPSDTLLIFLLKGMLPHKYRDNAQTQINVDRPMEVVIRRE